LIRPWREGLAVQLLAESQTDIDPAWALAWLGLKRSD
jgi:hypothetical protein